MKKPIVPHKPHEGVDQELILQAHPAVRVRRSIEIQVARNLLAHLRDEMLTYMADNGEEKPKTQDDDETIKTLFACDEAELMVFTGDGSMVGTVSLVWGNGGWDSVSDHGGGKIDKAMDEFLDWVSSEETRNDDETI